MKAPEVKAGRGRGLEVKAKASKGRAKGVNK